MSQTGTTKRYRVQLSQTVIEEAWVTVEAKSEEEALEIAAERAIDENVTWTFVDTIDDIEAIYATEIIGGRSEP